MPTRRLIAIVVLLVVGTVLTVGWYVELSQPRAARRGVSSTEVGSRERPERPWFAPRPYRSGATTPRAAGHAAASGRVAEGSPSLPAGPGAGARRSGPGLRERERRLAALVGDGPFGHRTGPGTTERVPVRASAPVRYPLEATH